MTAWLEERFRLREHGSTVRAEVRGGVVTFLAMSYIVFVQPAVLQSAGMDFGAVMVATCVASALATFVMAWWANYPVALAPVMGENFFFVSVVLGGVTGAAVSWEAALAAVFVSGVLFLLLSLVHLRERLLDALPLGLRYAIPTGIGLLIAFVGLQHGGLVVDAPGQLVALGPLGRPSALLTLFGLVITALLMVRGHAGALLWGLLSTTVVGLVTGLVHWHGLLSLPPDPTPVLGHLDLAALLDLAMLPVVIIFLFMVLFDTVGTLMGVGQQAGLMENGKLVRANRALLADAVGTTAGAVLGTSTVSSFIESAAGVAAGARTGLASMVTGVLFLLALFFHPLVSMVGGGVDAGGGHLLYPVTAPALILVGAMMMRGAKEIPWDDPSESIPAFLVMVGMPLTMSIADGLALGFLAWPLLKLLSGKTREIPPLLAVLSILLALVFVMKARLGG